MYPQNIPPRALRVPPIHVEPPAEALCAIQFYLDLYHSDFYRAHQSPSVLLRSLALLCDVKVGPNCNSIVFTNKDYFVANDEARTLSHKQKLYSAPSTNQLLGDIQRSVGKAVKENFDLQNFSEQGFWYTFTKDGLPFLEKKTIPLPLKYISDLSEKDNFGHPVFTPLRLARWSAEKILEEIKKVQLTSKQTVFGGVRALYETNT